MKHIFILLTILIVIPALYSEPTLYGNSNYEQYTLENGLELFVMEDFSSAPVRIEYSVRAGISSQTQTNTGFFPLYTKLFKYGYSEKQLSKMTATCNADSSRYIITVSPSKVKETMEILSAHAFSPVFSDKIIEKELSAFKTEVMQYAYTPAAFINSSIDARVFSSAPWKQDSGIYPSLFANVTSSQTRTILNYISKNWYTPQNSAIFISGSIKKEAALKIAEETFGKFPRAPNSETTSNVSAGNKIRKFVIYDNEFSEDFAQIIVQYTSLSMNQCELAAAAFNSDYSSIKKNLIDSTNLNIRAPEYINFSAAHKNGNSRLIIQSLLEKNKISPLEQTKLFISIINKASLMTEDAEFVSARKYLSKNFSSITSSSTSFMDYLSQYWAIDHLLENKNQTLMQKIISQPSEIISEDIEALRTVMNNENPYIFVLVNTKTYNKFFKNSEFEVINRKNGSWYTQKLKDNVVVSLPEINSFQKNMNYESSEFLEKFISEGKTSISSTKLNNEINVTFKKNSNSSNATVLIKIDGGKLAYSGKPGFETVMTNAISSNIQKELNNYALANLLDGYPSVQSETKNSCSLITIECQSDDVPLCIKAIGNALIYGEIKPAEADSYVYAVQTQKRLYNGNPINQMTFKGICQLFNNSLLNDCYDSEKDILQNTNYTDILAAYPKYLDANRYTITIAGKFDQVTALNSLENSLGMLSRQNQKIDNTIIFSPDISAKSKKSIIKLRHLFLTDISAEKAGPMPAVLVPTKNFSDPVQFWIQAPDYNSNDSIIFISLLLRLKENLEAQGKEIKLLLPEKNVPAAAITFINVPKTGEIDKLYSSTVSSLIKLLKSKNRNSFIESEEIKNTWILNSLMDTQSNKGTAKLIACGKLPDEYLTNYKFILDCTDTDFANVAEKYFSQEPVLKIYSADSKR